MVDIENIKKDISQQERVFKHYYPNATIGKKFKIREENIPSAVLRDYKGILWLKDFGDGEKARDCISVVMKNENCDFKTALEIIDEKILGNGNYKDNIKTQIHAIKGNSKDTSSISFTKTFNSRNE